MAFELGGLWCELKCMQNGRGDNSSRKVVPPSRQIATLISLTCAMHLFEFSIYSLILLINVARSQNVSEVVEEPKRNFNKLPGLEKFEKVRLTERNFGLVRNMHANWFAAGVKALLGQLGRRLYGQLVKDEQTTLASCLDRIEDKRDLVLAAQCLINARRAHLRRQINAKELLPISRVKNGDLYKSAPGNENDNTNSTIGTLHGLAEALTHGQNATKQHNLTVNNEKKFEAVKNGDKADESKKIIGEKFGIRKREIHPKLLDRPSAKGIFSAEFSEWAKRLRRFGVKKDHHKTWKGAKKPKSKWAIDRGPVEPKFEIRQADSLEKLASQEDRSAVFRVSNLISQLSGKNGTEPSQKWSRMYESLVRLKRANDQRQQSPGARVYEMRMYDLVLGRDEPSMGPKEKKSPQGLLQMGISLLQKLHGGDKSTRRNANFKWMSPRFAPLMPDQSEASKSILSPTILALYEPERNQSERGKKRAIGPELASMPEVLKATGLNKQDREALMQSLMEVSGSIGHVQTAMDLLKGLNFFEIEPELTEANERVLGAYTKMERSFEAEQEREIDRQGWTFLRQPQFDQLCRDQHAQFPDELTSAFGQFDSLDREARERAIWKRVERIARNIPDEIGDKLDRRKHARMTRSLLGSKVGRHRRQAQQQVKLLSVMEPIVLRPFMFTPVYGLSVLGPLVLSPNIFSPLVLAPSVLSPYILSPAAPIPYILSPYVFGPFILSPMALAPFILTPYVLSPNVLNPFALAPLILSPTVLSPDILSPQVLGGGILSPTVGSPAVLTESALMASVLSPSVLSRTNVGISLGQEIAN